MRVRTSVFLMALVAVSLLAAPAMAERRAYVFDKAHSQINFIAEARIFSAHGFFGTFDGDIQINPQDLADSSVTITIDAASINTRDERRDNHLRTADFFDTANHPQITFVSRKVSKSGNDAISIEGDMTIRGNTKPVVVPLIIKFFEGGRGRFTGEFKINRKDFGVSYNSQANPIDDMVTIQMDLNLRDKLMMEEQQRRRQQQQQQPPKQETKPPVQ